MNLDNSAARTFMRCPAMYQERYIEKIESVAPKPELEFGKRVHSLLEVHFKNLQAEQTGTPFLYHPTDYPPLEDSALEAEARVIFEAYRAVYPTEDFDVVEVERFVRVPLEPCCRESTEFEGAGHSTLCKGVDHFCTGKFDLVGRYKSSHPYFPNKLFIMDHKTEKRGGQGNYPQVWKNRAQVGLYQWAAEQIYEEPICHIIIDILTRQSPAGRCGPEFRRLTVQRTEWQCLEAVETMRWIVEQISRINERNSPDLVENESEFRLWPTNREECKWCPYESLHGEAGRDEETLRLKFKVAEDYLL